MERHTTRRDHRGPYGSGRAPRASAGTNPVPSGDCGPGYYDQGRDHDSHTRRSAHEKAMQAAMQEPREDHRSADLDAPKACREMSLREEIEALEGALFTVKARVGLDQRPLVGLVAMDEQEMGSPPWDGQRDAIDAARSRIGYLRYQVGQILELVEENNLFIEDRNRRLG